MIQLIDFESYPVKATISLLLNDKTTNKNIVWATSSYQDSGYEYSENNQIEISAISGINQWIVTPRVQKNTEQQQKRTRTKAEVFTPLWVCNKMNNLCDAEWFDRENVFNTEQDKSWTTTTDKVTFPEGKTWKQYVDLRKLEITCGEAPYICSRYEMTTGELIPLENRIGFLDRKLRVVNENTTDKEEWTTWAIRAFQSTYGYEYQGDNLLIARINLLLTFYEYYKDHWHEEPEKILLRKIANIISWNIWQMDGLKGTVPNEKQSKVNEQLSFTEFFENQNNGTTAIECRLHNWRSTRTLYYSDLKGVKRKMKFDFVIGNPPYQEQSIGEKISDASVYHLFMNESYKIGEKVELITPARFLFNNGNTPKSWNTKMLNDTHFKVLHYESNSALFFANNDIKGGVAIHYWDKTKFYEPIEHFTAYKELNSILKKVLHSEFISLVTIMYNQNKFVLDLLYSDYPELRSVISSKGTERRLTSGCLKYSCFHDNKTNGDIKILGVINNKRIYKYINQEYIEQSHENTNKYKVIIPANNGSGAIGEVVSTPLIGTPLVGFTQTFISVGAFDIESVAENALKYIKSKFCRVMLGVLKVTQNGKRDVWKYVPLQDFTENSDIDWSKSIHEIDLQLYKKYGLDESEIEFIEKNVKEMT